MPKQGPRFVNPNTTTLAIPCPAVGWNRSDRLPGSTTCRERRFRVKERTGSAIPVSARLRGGAMTRANGAGSGKYLCLLMMPMRHEENSGLFNELLIYMVC